MVRDGVITFPQRDQCKFALLGSGKALCDFVQLLSLNGFRAPVVITHPRDEHERDRSLYSKSPYQQDIFADVFSVAAEQGLEIYETQNVNESAALEWLDHRGSNVALSLGCRSIIRKNFLGFFNSRVLNYHASDLPRYQGGGAFSWQILNGETSYVSGTLHMIDEGIDTGAILLQGKERVVADHPYPADLIRVSVEVTRRVLGEFIHKIGKGQPFAAVPQELGNSTYFPRLYTETHGAIDWRWNADCIERFVRAFGYPNPGAWTYIESKKVYLARSKLADSSNKFHPFLAGLIYRGYDGGAVEVATGDGSLIIDSLRTDEGDIPAGSQLKVGHRLHTPAAEVEEALSHRHRY